MKKTIKLLFIALSIASLAILNGCKILDEGLGQSTGDPVENPTKKATEPKKIESMELEVDFVGIMNFFNPFGASAMAAEVVAPYCDSSCDSNSCLYLVKIDRNTGEEKIICERNRNKNNKTSFKIKNYKRLSSSVLEVRTSLESSQTNFDGGPEDDHFSGIFSLTDESMRSKRGKVSISQTNYKVSDIVKDEILESPDDLDNEDAVQKANLLVSPENISSKIQMKVLELKDYLYEEGDFEFIYLYLGKALLESRVLRDEIRRVLKPFKHEGDKVYTSDVILSEMPKDIHEKNYINEKKKKQNRELREKNKQLEKEKKEKEKRERADKEEEDKRVAEDKEKRAAEEKKEKAAEEKKERADKEDKDKKEDKEDKDKKEDKEDKDMKEDKEDKDKKEDKEDKDKKEDKEDKDKKEDKEDKDMKEDKEDKDMKEDKEDKDKKEDKEDKDKKEDKEDKEYVRRLAPLSQYNFS